VDVGAATKSKTRERGLSARSRKSGMPRDRHQGSPGHPDRAPTCNRWVFRL
jgi:hypothetical protein